MIKYLKLLTVAGVLTFTLSHAASAQPVSSRHGIGPYMGYGANPDQFVFGAQGIFGPAGSAWHFAPGADFGFGDDLTVVTLNFDVTYDFFPSTGRTAFFVGAGPTVAFYSSDHFDSQTEAGLSLVGGAKFPAGVGNSFNLGVRVGVGDIPDVRFTAAYIFDLH